MILRQILRQMTKHQCRPMLLLLILLQKSKQRGELSQVERGRGRSLGRSLGRRSRRRHADHWERRLDAAAALADASARKASVQSTEEAECEKHSHNESRGETD
jgi:hypothetical protein